MADTGTLNFAWSQTLIAGFVAAGVADAVISPGSRSTPLALAILRQSRITSHVAVDERSAAFFGLGLAKASRRPVLLLATSGTAPANWFPAIVEASLSGVPMILISADRPPELQACGANQTIHQPGMFGAHVRASHSLGTPFEDFDPACLHRLAAQACEQACWPYPGPVHINQPFREPLLPANPLTEPVIPDTIRISPPALKPDHERMRHLATMISGRPGLIVCGDMPTSPMQNQAITGLAARLNCPILAEPLSGLRFGPHDRTRVCVRYNQWLANGQFGDQYRPEWLIRFGAYPVTRHLQAYVASAGNTHIHVDPWPRWSDPANRISDLLRTEASLFCQALLGKISAPATNDWFAAFAEQERISKANEDAGHIGVLIDELPEDTPLFVGNSLAIRQLDSYSGSGQNTIHFYGNRGASGIDGNISMAMGIAQAHGRVVALLGDLTCQHDLGGLALASGRDALIVVVNNHGGGIFDHLPQRQLPEFETGWRTPQQIDFQHAAQTFGLGYGRADNNENFRPVLRAALAAGGPQLIELLVAPA